MATPAPRYVQVTPATLRSGDMLIIGHRRYIVRRTTALPDGYRRVTFATGEHLSAHRSTALAALRPEPSTFLRSTHASPPSRAEIVAQVLAGCALVLTLTLAVVIR